MTALFCVIQKFVLNLEFLSRCHYLALNLFCLFCLTDYFQGKAQGCVSGICSFAHVVAPLTFSPLTGKWNVVMSCYLYFFLAQIVMLGSYSIATY